jgi:thiaminase
MQDELLNQLEGENLESIGVSPEEITRNYISYLKRISDSRDLQLTVSAVAPCLVYT